MDRLALRVEDTGECQQHFGPKVKLKPRAFRPYEPYPLSPPSLSLPVPLLPLVHAVKVPESSVSCHSPSEMPHSIDVC